MLFAFLRTTLLKVFPTQLLMDFSSSSFSSAEIKNEIFAVIIREKSEHYLREFFLNRKYME
jgi:hypothetical protein